MQFKSHRGALQLGSQRHQFDDLALGRLELAGDD
jgi:hypothetical protein